MSKPYSYDFRLKVLQAIELDGLKKSEASELFNISRNTLNLWLQRKAQTEDVQALPNRPPPATTIKLQIGSSFGRLPRLMAISTQVEMAQLWQDDISSRTISRGLKKIGFTRKKRPTATKNGMSRNGKPSSSSWPSQAEETIVYVDEAGMDNREDYDYGPNSRGQRFHALKPGRRQGRVNMIAALCKGQLMAPFTVVGSCNRSVFEIWLEKCLIPVLKPGQVVVMDNATFHKGGRIEQLIKEAGCELLYLPAYSPDFNKIERCWSWLKSRIRKQLDLFDCLRDAMEYVLHLAS